MGLRATVSPWASAGCTTSLGLRPKASARLLGAQTVSSGDGDCAGRAHPLPGLDDVEELCAVERPLLHSQSFTHYFAMSSLLKPMVSSSLISTSRVKGRMQLLALDIDTTGWKWESEIILLSVFSPGAYFTQYVMPQCDLNPTVAKKFGLEVVDNNNDRKLIDTTTQEAVATKSLKNTLRHFVRWLRGAEKGTDGIILFTFDRRRAAIPLLLRALEKYRLTEKFSYSVKGFVVLREAAKTAFKQTFVSYSMTALSRILLGLHEKPISAWTRSIVTFQLMDRLFGGRQHSVKKNRDLYYIRMLGHMGTYMQPLRNEAERLKVQLRMYSLKLMFVGKSQVEKRRFFSLRKFLAESGVDYMLLKATFQYKGEDGIEDLIRTKLTHIKKKQLQMLRKALEHHFQIEQ
ncbi:Maternal protein exuperantia [Gryllus bimaculatus]|nr:Maternal protein exuperantia [Gryllus bimaculatus]